ncbi:efflux transporter outer membrane subunit [Neisseriaceae bacterium TC5R-5]|nr:efflux transporter outer membrane subunit [Neisseriaceae bacterium TC5R-5]
MHNKMLPGILLTMSLVACQSTPYQRPSLQTPLDWQQSSLSTASQTVAPDHWWQGFADPVLLHLLEQVRVSNPDLETALLNVRKAQLAAGLADSDARPSLSGTVSVSRGRPVDKAAEWSNSSTSSLSTSYELDLWGRVAAVQRSANERFIASCYDEKAARLLSDSTVASVYWEIAALKARIVLADANLDKAQQVLKLTRSRHQAGAIGELDVLQAERVLLEQQNSRRDLQVDLQQQHNALALLLNQPLAQPLPDIAELTLTPVMQPIVAGLPSSLLERRPDLMAAEARLRAALADVDQSKAAFFPVFSLTGSLGTSSTSLGNLLQNPLLALGGGVSLPFLQWQQQSLLLKSSQADYQLAVVNFRKSLYAAYQEVDNALNSRARFAENAQRQFDSLDLSRRDEVLTHRRYLAGEVDMQSWLTASESRRQAEESVLNLRLAQLKNLADLYKILGGAPLGVVSTSE